MNTVSSLKSHLPTQPSHRTLIIANESSEARAKLAEKVEIVGKEQPLYKRLLPWVLGVAAFGSILCLVKPCTVCSDFNLQSKNVIGKIKISDQVTSCDQIPSMNEMCGVSTKVLTDLAEKAGIYGQRSFMEKWRQNCNTAKDLGMPATEIADHLDALRKLASHESPFTSYDYKLYSDAEQEKGSGQQWKYWKISYNPSLHPNSTVGSCSKAQVLHVKADYPPPNSSMEIRKNVFNEIINAQDPDRITFRNPLNNVHITTTSRQIENMRRYSFYDGVDPVQIAAMITGHFIGKIERAIGKNPSMKESDGFLSSIAISTFRTVPILPLSLRRFKSEVQQVKFP